MVSIAGDQTTLCNTILLSRRMNTKPTDACKMSVTDHFILNPHPAHPRREPRASQEKFYERFTATYDDLFLPFSH